MDAIRMLGPFEDSEFGRDVPRPAKAGQAGQGAQYERSFLCSHSVRHWRAWEALRQAQSRELCRTAPPCLARLNGVGGELHFMGSTYEFVLSRQPGKGKKYLIPNGEMV